MSIANELSCDVAAAVLTYSESQDKARAEGLTNIILEFHSAMQQLNGEARRGRRRSPLLSAPPPPKIKSLNAKL